MNYICKADYFVSLKSSELLKHLFIFDMFEICISIRTNKYISDFNVPSIYLVKPILCVGCADVRQRRISKRSNRESYLPIHEKFAQTVQTRASFVQYFFFCFHSVLISTMMRLLFYDSFLLMDLFFFFFHPRLTLTLNLFLSLTLYLYIYRCISLLFFCYI